MKTAAHDSSVVSAADFPLHALGEPTPRQDIQFMPPGVHAINAVRGGKLVKLKMKVHAGTAAVIAKAFGDHVTAAKEGRGDMPFFDFNHNDDEASGQPQEFYWGGDDLKTGGVRCKTAWNEDGSEAIRKKRYTRFSPQFIPDDASGEVIGMPVNMGGLVNRAAFKSIQPVGAKGAQTHTDKKMNTETDAAVAAKDQEIAKLTLRIKELEASDTVKAKDAKIVTLETQIRQLEEEKVTKAKEHAKAVVAGYVGLGKIPPQDKDAIAGYEDFYLANPVRCKAVLDSLPANPALATVVSAAAGSAAAVAAAKPGEHLFMTKAREFQVVTGAKTLNESIAAFCATPEGNRLYQDYNAKLGQNK